MAQTLQEWITNEVQPAQNKRMRYLNEQYFPRIESRPNFHDNSLFFSPADGVVIAAHESISAKKSIIDVKGVNYSVQDLFQDDTITGNFLVVSIFMTFYSQHQNYIPYSGARTWQILPPLSTYNKPMLKTEQALLNQVINPEFLDTEEWMKYNEREVSEIYSPLLQQNYYLVRLGDYDVDTFLNYTQPDGEVRTNFLQGDRFGMITYGSCTLLVIPQFKDGIKFTLRPAAKVGMYVKCREDALVTVNW